MPHKYPQQEQPSESDPPAPFWGVKKTTKQNLELWRLEGGFASSDPAGSRELVPPRLLPLRGVLQGPGRRALHRRPSQQHLLRGGLQQVRSDLSVMTPTHQVCIVGRFLPQVTLFLPFSCRTFAPKCAACLQPILPAEVSRR